MAQVNKIDSNATGLRIAEEATPGVLPGSPVWTPYEPNSYGSFGGTVTNVARNPINDSRQRSKGVTTDLDADGDFNTDFTQTNLADIMQGLLAADYRLKGEEVATNIDGTANEFDVAATAGFFVGTLLFSAGHTDAVNNGLFEVDTVTLNTLIGVTASTLVNDATPDGTLVAVGFQFAAGDLDVDASGNFATLTSTVKDLTELGIIPGEWIYIGGDSASLAFSTAANNGFKRVRSVATNAIVIDKSDVAMVTEASTTETVQIFLARVLKNEAAALIVRRTYQLERSLGAPDDTLPAEVQAEYLTGQVWNEASFNIPQADKFTVDVSFLGLDQETIDGPTSLKSGTRPGLTKSDAFNTSSDFTRLRMALVSTTAEAPAALFAFINELTITVNNNATVNKAVSVLGGFDITLGTFEVGGSINAYFANVSTITAIRNNSDVTLDAILAKANAGVFFDIPLISLGDGRLEVEANEAVTVPLDIEAARGCDVVDTMDHTLMIGFFDYLPSNADT